MVGLKMSSGQNKPEPDAFPTRAVTRALSKKVNEGTADGDRVSGEQLRGRVRQKESDRNLSGHNDQIKNKPEPKPAPKHWTCWFRFR
ncbi:hypothetical protein DSCOOX_62540 [Desulfosarcina ovata subsp. ovata]|uniref:Uncharacterized protein n=1 Tax=Desulfosarcina ovata subsp. ovata TaxID=2752305 RepID=A0A5K8AN69_9BACT|nr:hypothetical protein DSCOOX_62540 [Desulfosarcina ovata subsp. ovata]